MDMNSNQFETMLRNVTMNTVTAKDQNFALNLLLSIERGETQISLSNCFALGENNIHISPKVYKEIQDEILKGMKIAAIRILRSATGMGLKEAKDIIENPRYFKQYNKSPEL